MFWNYTVGGNFKVLGFMRNKKSNLILISSNQKIIIVDDNQKYAQQLSSLLLSKKETIQISCAENIRSGYKKILKGNFEVFFCDITIRKRLVGFLSGS
ncbi:hypothetical protein LEP1GSC088_4228 [Leptospira interrogans str. L1207]|nr:hypothetical protein LEP1GSC088_4228 [Leptospira interrogans str. L1207]